jgi:hypothetical protein
MTGYDFIVHALVGVGFFAVSWMVGFCAGIDCERERDR